jgi:hypothetical protein
MELLGYQKAVRASFRMLEVCPGGKESNCFFVFRFLQPLPRELCSHLDDKEIPPQLAIQEDIKWAQYSHD